MLKVVASEIGIAQTLQVLLLRKYGLTSNALRGCEIRCFLCKSVVFRHFYIKMNSVN